MSDSEEATLKSINLKTLLTLLGIFGIILTTGGVWFLTQYRLDRLEDDMTSVRTYLKEPRFTLEDYEVRTNSFREGVTKELDRRAAWMSAQDSFRVEQVRINAEVMTQMREIKAILLELQKDVKESTGRKLD